MDKSITNLFIKSCDYLFIFEPDFDELLIYMNVYLSQWLVTGVHKFVGRFCRDNHDLPCVCFECIGANGKSGDAFLDDENLFVRMLMQANRAARFHNNPDEGDFCFLMLNALELIHIPIKGKFIAVENFVVHVDLLCLFFAWEFSY